MYRSRPRASSRTCRLSTFGPANSPSLLERLALSASLGTTWPSLMAIVLCCFTPRHARTSSVPDSADNWPRRQQRLQRRDGSLESQYHGEPAKNQLKIAAWQRGSQKFTGSSASTSEKGAADTKPCGKITVDWSKPANLLCEVNRVGRSAEMLDSRHT